MKNDTNATLLLRDRGGALQAVYCAVEPLAEDPLIATIRGDANDESCRDLGYFLPLKIEEETVG